MKLKTRFLLILIIFSFLSSLFSFFPNQKAYALTDKCPKYDQWVNLPKINFSVVKNNDNTFTARITSPKSAMDRWNNNAPDKDYQILAFIGNVVFKNQLNIGKPILYTKTGSSTPQTFSIIGYENGTPLTPGQTYDITFRIFTATIPPIPDNATLNVCAIDSNPINISYTAPQVDQPGGSNPLPDDPNSPTTPEDKTCEEECPSGVCNENDECIAAFACKKYSNGNYKCITAIGGIETNPEKFVQNILRILLGLAGGILLILIIINGYKIMTSQGDPEKLKDAREGIIAAIAGILLIIFSLSILQLITVDIIGIPGFGS